MRFFTGRHQGRAGSFVAVAIAALIAALAIAAPAAAETGEAVTAAPEAAPAEAPEAAPAEAVELDPVEAATEAASGEAEGEPVPVAEPEAAVESPEPAAAAPAPEDATSGSAAAPAAKGAEAVESAATGQSESDPISAVESSLAGSAVTRVEDSSVGPVLKRVEGELVGSNTVGSISRFVSEATAPAVDQVRVPTSLSEPLAPLAPLVSGTDPVRETLGLVAEVFRMAGPSIAGPLTSAIGPLTSAITPSVDVRLDPPAPHPSGSRSGGTGATGIAEPLSSAPVAGPAGAVGGVSSTPVRTDHPAAGWSRPLAAMLPSHDAALGVGDDGAPKNFPPERQPPPSRAPGIGSTSGGSSFVPLAALLALLALAAPAGLRRRRPVPDCPAPVEFVCALERPG